MIYFDNAATTFPKPGRVLKAVQNAFAAYGANPGRSGHELSIKTAMKIYECRELAAKFFNAKAEDVVFTQNCSHALNIAIKGLLHDGDHVIISDLEHNSVLRPVHALAQRGKISYSIACIDPEDDEKTLDSLRKLVTPRTRMIACTHGSNAFGIRLPVEKIGAFAHSKNLMFVLDCAQTAGVLPIDMKRQYIDFLCTAGHKSLYGPSGTGILVTPHGNKLVPLMDGGTGTNSADFVMPPEPPERLECGTVNTMGIIGLKAGISFVNERGLDNLFFHEMKIAKEIFRALSGKEKVILYQKDMDVAKHLPVLSFNVKGKSSEEVAAVLSDKGFALRGGLHCAPLAHQKMNTMDTGAVRISIGAFNTMRQAEQLCYAIKNC